MKWVTWEGVGIDRIGCAWLIRRFVDPAAELVFVPLGQKPLPDGAEPYDIPGERLSHHGGHCSFHAFLAAYDLTTPCLSESPGSSTRPTRSRRRRSSRQRPGST